jgi:hypothetical protein
VVSGKPLECVFNTFALFFVKFLLEVEAGKSMLLVHGRNVIVILMELEI